jgi:energy-converting hydrogenase Eha subunit B
MIELLLRVLPLALGAAITPSLFAVQLLIVSNDP